MHPGSEIPILNVKNLTVAYQHGETWHDAVRDVSLRISSGETLGLVGESGSGKTTLLYGIMRYLPAGGRLQAGTIELCGQDLSALSDSEMRHVWGKQIGTVPQNPQTSLNPTIHVGEQIAETVRHHLSLDVPAARRRVIELLEMVHIADPHRVSKSYPHQISGGMQQRILIAMALSTEPILLVLDEPTTNLDVTTQAEILDLIGEQIQVHKTAAIYVTHNLGVAANICDRIAVMYAGELVEEAPTSRLFEKPLHPYTQGLLDSVPRLGETKSSLRLRAIEGQIPPIDEHPPGCVFAPRCPIAIEICKQHTPLYVPETGRRTRCHRWEELMLEEVFARQKPASNIQQQDEVTEEDQTLKLENISVHFPVRRSLREALSGSPTKTVKAVDGVNMQMSKRETLGLVGESGSGKTTLARAVMGLVEKTGGEMELLGISLPSRLSERHLDTLRSLQMVFQDSDGALNPYISIGESLRRPLISLAGINRAQADVEVKKLLNAVHLRSSFAQRLPGQLSGGEKQRVAIARAFASNPDLLICDEPVSSLDVSVQASILNLLNDLQLENHSSLLFISHDLAVVGYLADYIFVMYLGQIMQEAQAVDLFDAPYHPYTEALLSAIPVADPQVVQDFIRMEDALPNPTEELTGCPYHTRCQRTLGDVCEQETPPWQEDEDGKRIYCHIPLEELRASQKRTFAQHRSERE